ncbi:MAG TPA: glycosyltransferase family 4 protein, partial [Candidatus Paceibacterota bacterium]|nr:glycosyltransferase family 4 protein [Candidatus Paceibacterota bacterium]
MKLFVTGGGGFIGSHRGAIKICFVTTADLTLRFILFDQMEFLKQQGFEVWGVCSAGKWAGELEQRGFRVATVRMTRQLFTPLADARALWELVRLFRQEKFDIVHTHTPKASFLGQIAAFVAGVPIRIYTIHGLFFLKDSSWRRKLAFGTVEKILSFLVNKALFVNREDMEEVQRMNIYGSNKITYIGADVDLSRFDPSLHSRDEIQKAKSELGIPLDKVVIGIVARLVWEKGFSDLFSAMQIILQKFPHAVLLVVGPSEPEKGDGFQPSVVETYGIQENVVFAGERTDVPTMYALMDVFVLPSYREGLGLSALEASAME